MPLRYSNMLNTPNQPLSVFFFYINGSLDLEQIVGKLSVSVQVPETIDLLCPKTFETLLFEVDPKEAKLFTPQIPTFLLGVVSAVFCFSRFFCCDIFLDVQKAFWTSNTFFGRPKQKNGRSFFFLKM